MITEVLTLEDVLKAKDARKKRQDRLRENTGMPIVSITVNIPGPIKDSILIRQLCDFAVQELKQGLSVVAEEHVYLTTGPEAVLAIRGNAENIKKFCIKIEENFSFGRLLDLDVFDEHGFQLARNGKLPGRKCFICSKPAVICMREKRHSKEELAGAIKSLFFEFMAYQTKRTSHLAEDFGRLAVESMLFEAACTPAPGLVDRNNSGAHSDMDIYTFMSSSAALAGSMARCAQAGMNHQGELNELLSVLRCIGREAEQTMFAATSGINTQKGLLFTLGIVCAAVGYLKAKEDLLTARQIFNTVALICQNIVEKELGVVNCEEKAKLTAGQRLYYQYGIKGIRGELEQGLPAVRMFALPALEQAMSNGLSVNDALIQTLLVLMTCVEDTTVINRHNPEMLSEWVKPKVLEILDQGGMYNPDSKDRVYALDEEFIRCNISPGGAADLVAVTWFVYQTLKS